VSAPCAIHIGFTGTRRGLTDSQRIIMRRILVIMPDFIAHHGAAPGADQAFDAMCVNLTACTSIVMHPSTHRLDEYPSAVLGPLRVRRPARPPLDRNEDIVGEAQIVIACPARATPYRSGTWSAIRDAMELERPLAIIEPSGVVELHHADQWERITGRTFPIPYVAK
jgi:hypothetical protein